MAVRRPVFAVFFNYDIRKTETGLAQTLPRLRLQPGLIGLGPVRSLVFSSL